MPDRGSNSGSYPFATFTVTEWTLRAHNVVAGSHYLGSFRRPWRPEKGVSKFYPFCRHLALNGPIFLTRHPRHHLQTMLGVMRIFFVFVVLGNRHTIFSLRPH